MDQLQSFLHFERRHHRGDRRGGGDFAFEDLVAAEQGAAISEVQKLVITLGHRAFVAGRGRGSEHLHHALNLLDSGVNPRGADFPTLTIHPEPRFAIIEAADHDVDVGEKTEAQVSGDVAAERVNHDIGVDFESPLGRNLRL